MPNQLYSRGMPYSIFLLKNSSLALVAWGLLPKPYQRQK